LLKNKKVLISGGAGFLGSHLSDLLIQEGYDVVCLDNFYTGNINNINHLLSSKQFTLIEQDVCNSISLKIDEIYNLASPASPPNYQRDPIFTTKTNILGSLNLLELAKLNNAKIFQASTSEVYGDPKVHPQDEKYWGNVNPVGIRSCYDESKRCVETLFFDFNRQYNLLIKIVRIFNTYGPRMDPNDGRVVSNFITQAIQNRPLTIYGDGTQTRSFCYVDDLIRGFYKFMNSNNQLTGPINLGNPTEFSMLELAEKIIDHTNSKSTIEFKPLPEDDPTQRKPDITIAQEQLDWEPRVSLDEGIARTTIYFEKLLKEKAL